MRKIIILTESQLNNVIKKVIEEQDGYTQQVKWFESYLRSPKYLERLKSELPNKSKTEIEKERNIRLNNFIYAKNNHHFVNSIGKKPGYIAGVYINKSKPTGFSWNWRTKSWEVVEEYKGNKKPGHVYFEKEYSPQNFKPASGFETIVTHEYGHSADAGGERIPQATIDKIYKYTGGGKMMDPNYDRYYKTTKGQEFTYECEPSEFINRIQPIRYLLKQEKIYDANTQVFTQQHYDLMMKNQSILNNVHFQDVMECLKGSNFEKVKYFIDLMNTVAKSNNNTGSSYV